MAEAASGNCRARGTFATSRESTAALRPGRLFRSSELSRLDDDGRETLRRLGITDVADLRAAREVARRGPGLVPDGVEIHLLPFPDLAEDEPNDDGGAARRRVSAAVDGVNPTVPTSRSTTPPPAT